MIQVEAECWGAAEFSRHLGKPGKHGGLGVQGGTGLGQTNHIIVLSLCFGLDMLYLFSLQHTSKSFFTSWKKSCCLRRAMEQVLESISLHRLSSVAQALLPGLELAFARALQAILQ